MRTRIIALLLCAAFFLSSHGQEKPFYEDSRPARKLQIDNKILLELHKGGSNVEIVLDEKAYKSTRFAALELGKFLSRQLGIEIPVVTQPAADKVSFILGINSFSKAAGIDDSKLVRDAFIIKTIKNKIYILGRDDAQKDTQIVVTDRNRGGGSTGLRHERGTAFGVYDFLERFCGVRFYHANPLFTIVPDMNKIQIPVIDIYDRPDYESRYYGTFYGKLEDNAPKHGWSPSVFFSPSKAMNYVRFRMETRTVPDCHGLTALNFIERFSQTHPEYFALHTNGKRYFDKSLPHTGQLCFSSGIMDEIFEDAKAILSGDKEKIKARSPFFINKSGGYSVFINRHTPGSIFNFMPQDAYYHCRCEKCLPHIKTPQSISNFLWGKSVELAKRLQAAGVKGYVSTMAYPPCHLPPENLELPENIIVMVAQNGPWNPANVQALDHGLIREWNRRSKQNKVWMWNYICKVPSRNLVLPGVPCGTPKAVGKYLKSVKNDINGSFMESGSAEPADHYMMQVLSYYVFGKLAWNTDIDVDALLEEYYRLCYGPAALEMSKIDNQIEKLWLTKIGGNTIMNNLGPMNIPPSDNELWNEIYNEKQIGEYETLIKTARDKLKNDKQALERVNYYSEAVIKPLRKNLDIYRARTNSIDKFSVELSKEKPAVLWLQKLHHDGKPFPATKVTVKDFDTQLEITFDCDEPEMSKVIAVERAKDDVSIWQDNDVEVVLNPSADRINYYHWMINSKGAWYDSSRKMMGSKSTGDPKWDSRAKVKVTSGEKGWQAVLTVDKSPEWNRNGFVVNFSRHRVIAGTDELFTWSPFLVKGFHELERFGSLVPPAASTNIIKNGSFIEKNWPNWGGWQPQNIKPGEKREHDFNTFVFGNKSLKLSYDGDEMSQRLNVGQTLYNLTPGKKYRLSFYVKLENVIPLKRSGGAGLQIWNSSKNFWFPETRLSGTMPWTRQTFEFQSLPDSNPRTTNFNCVLFFASGTAWFDGITLEEIE